MRKSLKAILLVGLAAAPIAASGPTVQAADLGVTIHHKRLRLVRDYDGTAVVVHLGRTVRNPDGTVVVLERVHQPVLGPQPLYYFNGQPVRNRYVLRRNYIAF